MKSFSKTSINYWKVLVIDAIDIMGLEVMAYEIGSVVMYSR